ncbi:Protein ASPARTIC PROTEASE IN GUARD CELL 2 [Dendrobium catenatum]|uniref:Protein ASPARTIC PROTEASE IN GUARD CELL 2 n=1 Tax=Dendrobium catenatum TaxID=906689 RepID=A0A2I0WVT5_9ASPA|nr:Protein ASPARTIC PROTEASE IN GUARD CELL 2 [Dendrobium catenatum]
MHQDRPSHVELFPQDQARLDYIHRQASHATARLNPIGDSLLARVPTIIDCNISFYSYIIEIGLGTPTKFFFLTFDTGTDLTWTQCEPCVNCHTQKNPFYDPTKSFTFTNIPCDSSYCTQLDKFGCSSNFSCLYEEEYYDNSITNGSLIEDVLYFNNDIIYNFVFGCGHNNTGVFDHEDGLLGLGRGPISIINQTSQLYNEIFSYCLPSSFYFLNLTAISVDGERLTLPPTIFSEPGTMLDSGTTFSYLPPTAYSALRSIFQKKMSNYPMAPPISNLDTCYNFTNYPTVLLPSISLIYDGEVMTNLHSTGRILMFSEFIGCLPFVENEDDSEVVIIGNMQYLTFNVVYDVGNSQIGFGPNGCS